MLRATEATSRSCCGQLLLGGWRGGRVRFEPAPGVVWFDAHAGFQRAGHHDLRLYRRDGCRDPDRAARGRGMLATVPGASPVPKSPSGLAGTATLDPPEEARLTASQIVHPEGRSTAITQGAVVEVPTHHPGCHRALHPSRPRRP